MGILFWSSETIEVFDVKENPGPGLHKNLLLGLRSSIWVPKRMIMVRTSYDLCVLAHQAKQKGYRVWSRNRMQADLKENRVARRHAQFFMKMLIERSLNGASHS